jgi:hypothetical protein
MARVNIEDCWWTDPRRTALQRMGVDADGVAMRAWKLAQDFWKHGRALVPKGLFETLDGAADLIKVGLAEIRESSVYIKGSSAYLDWIAEKRERVKEAGRLGGRVSAQRPRDAKGRLLPSDYQATTKRTPSAGQTEPSESKLSASGSFSVSGSNTQNEESIGAASAGALPAVAQELGLGRVPQQGLSKPAKLAKANQFVAAYVKAYQTRFPGSRPEDLNDGKVRGQILNWIAGYPLERACDLIQVYFQMDTKWFGTKGYDFLTFRHNLNKIGQALDTGQDPDGNGIDWSKVNLS